ncbi:recombinase RecQ, partial [Rhodococcus fascians]|nr:recombinase RecQ [Rhodococcus fascians]
HPLLVRSVAERLATVGKLENLGVMQVRPGHPPVSAANSAFRVAGLVDSWEVPDVSSVDGPILLVDLLTDTGWTFTCATAALQAAGADAILPFALATPK